MKYYIQLQLIIGLLHSYIIIKIKNWEKLPLNLLFLVACFFAFQTYLISTLFMEFTYKSWDFILSNLLVPEVLLVFLLLGAYGALGMWYSIATAKILKVIV